MSTPEERAWAIEALENLEPPRLPKIQTFMGIRLEEYDKPDLLKIIHFLAADFERREKNLREAAGFKRNHPLRAYVLVGFPRDTFTAAEDRLEDCLAAGFMPMAMLYRNAAGETSSSWRRFQKSWARPAIIASRESSRA